MTTWNDIYGWTLKLRVTSGMVDGHASCFLLFWETLPRRRWSHGHLKRPYSGYVSLLDCCSMHNGPYTGFVTSSASPKKHSCATRRLLHPGKNARPVPRKHCLQHGISRTKHRPSLDANWDRMHPLNPLGERCRACLPPAAGGRNTQLPNQRHLRSSPHNIVRPSPARATTIELANGNYENCGTFYYFADNKSACHLTAWPCYACSLRVQSFGG